MGPADIASLRELVKQYLEPAQHPDQERKREIWRRFHRFAGGPVPSVASAAGYFIWTKERLPWS